MKRIQLNLFEFVMKLKKIRKKIQNENCERGWQKAFLINIYFQDCIQLIK